LVAGIGEIPLNFVQFLFGAEGATVRRGVAPEVALVLEGGFDGIDFDLDSVDD